MDRPILVTEMQGEAGHDPESKTNNQSIISKLN